MKISKLLVLTALWLGIASSAKAEVPEGVWSMPDPSEQLEFTDFTDDGTRYILFNPATKMFFASGNGWNTMASLRTFGMEIWLEETTEEDAPEGSYRLCDNNVNNPARSTGEGDMFTDDGNSTWVDHGSQGNYSWAYEIVNGCVRFQNVALIADKPEYTGMYLGFDGNFIVSNNTAGDASHRDAYTAILRHVDPTVAGVSVDWKAVTVDSYEAFIADEEAYAAYQNGVKQYLASVGLKTAIEEAEALNIDVTAALAVYSNTESTVDDMTKAQATLTELIDVKAKLKAAIEEYEAKGFTATDAAKAVLNNSAATKAEVEQAHSDLDAAFIEWGKGNASVENPADMTTKIVNPHFDNGDCTTGWSGDAFGRGGTVADGAEHYSKNYNTYQKITGLTAGIYAVGVNGFYRSGNYGGDAEKHWLAKDDASKYAKLYATVGENTRQTPIVNVMSGAQAENPGGMAVTYTDPETEEDVTVYVPNTMAQGDTYFHTLGQYANKLYVAVDEAGELTIGVKKTSQISGDWSLFDDFSLTYYGAAADACKLYLDESMKNFGEYTIEEGTLYTEAYLTAYQQAIQGEKTANSLDEVNAILNGIDNAEKAIATNISLWQDYVAICKKGLDMMVDDEYQEMTSDEWYDLCDYLEGEYEGVIEKHTLTNEELEAEIAKLNNWITVVDDQNKQDVYDGKNMTKFITNPTFESSTTKNTGNSDGWTVDRVSGGNVTPGPIDSAGDTFIEKVGYYNSCFESWHCHKWDVWQEIKNLPVGMYELEVQGYVRCEVGGYNRGDELEPNYPSPVYLYMNNALSQFPSVYSEIPAEAGVNFEIVEDWTTEEINGNLYPNSMGGAAQCFHIDEDHAGMYKTTAYGLIAKEGDTFRIGVKMDADQDWWCIWDNFKLTYRTPKAEIVQPILEEELAKLDLSKPMGKDIYEKAAAVKAAAEAAIAAADGQAMFDALSDVYDLSAAIIESSALFAQLQTANESMYEATFDSENEAAKAEATALYTTINSGIEDHSITDAEAKEYLEKIEAMYTPLALPAGMDQASDNNPIECTKVIKSASFETEDFVSTSEGWNNAGNLGNDDTQKGALAMEFWQVAFDMSQTIIGLPEGTYEVTVDAWCRMGDNAENYKEWQADPAATMALLYAVDGDSTVYTAPVANMMKAGEALLESTGNEGETEYTVEDLTYYLPGSLVSGKGIIEMNEGVYTNKLIAKVKADGKLTVGIKKTEEKTNSWVVLDDFKLFYLGKESSQTPSPDLTGIDDLDNKAEMKVEYFTLDGRKATYAQKGIMIQKVTFSNGATLIKKIRK